MVFELAELLGKFEGEILRELTAEDFAHWMAYLKIKNSKARQRRSAVDLAEHGRPKSIRKPR